MRSRLPLTVLTLVGAFAGGLVSSQLLEGKAHALNLPFASTFYVPTDGIAFRTFDGRMVARLSYNMRGGIFDVYDGQGERPAISVRADMLVPTGMTKGPQPATDTCNPPFTLDVVGTKHPKPQCL
jgi:hypothetical protein